MTFYGKQDYAAQYNIKKYPKVKGNEGKDEKSRKLCCVPL